VVARASVVPATPPSRRASFCSWSACALPLYSLPFPYRRVRVKVMGLTIIRTD
jgi:hypothetical protein